MNGWTPFRPTKADLDRIAGEVSGIPATQQAFGVRAPGLKVPDRAAHQYQIAGSRVRLRIADTLPANLHGLGLFLPGKEYAGLARLSTGLGCPHLETDPDFIGLMVAFATPAGQRIDILAINHPQAPSPNHREFMQLMDAATDGAGAKAPIFSGLGTRNLPDLLASNLRVTIGLIRRMGLVRGLGAALHVVKQTTRTAFSATAHQTFWAGIVEAGGAPGKIMFRPVGGEDAPPAPPFGPRHLSQEWRVRQAHGDVRFDLYWLPYIDERATSTTDMARTWEERPQLIGHLTFPQADLTSEDAKLWAALTLEMGANPAAHWVAGVQNDPPEPGTEFGCARKIAYRLSQEARGVLPEASYAHVFQGAPIGEALAAELARRRAAKAAAGHVDQA